MPKRKASKTNSSPSQQEAAPNKPDIKRVVKQKDTTADDNKSAQAQSSSTVLPTEENQTFEADSEVNNNQSQSIKVSELNSSSALTDDAVPQTIEAENEQLDLPPTVETAAVNLSESTASIESTSDEDGQSEIDLDQAQSQKKPAYKKLETATNSSGQTFNVREKIEVSTCNFGIQKVFIISLYSAPDGSIWAYYHPVDKTQRQLWKRGCCRIEDLKKLSENVSIV